MAQALAFLPRAFFPPPSPLPPPPSTVAYRNGSLVNGLGRHIPCVGDRQFFRTDPATIGLPFSDSGRGKATSGSTVTRFTSVGGRKEWRGNDSRLQRKAQGSVTIFHGVTERNVGTDQTERNVDTDQTYTRSSWWQCRQPAAESLRNTARKTSIWSVGRAVERGSEYPGRREGRER